MAEEIVDIEGDEENDTSPEMQHCNICDCNVKAKNFSIHVLSDKHINAKMGINKKKDFIQDIDGVSVKCTICNKVLKKASVRLHLGSNKHMDNERNSLKTQDECETPEVLDTTNVIRYQEKKAKYYQTVVKPLRERCQKKLIEDVRKILDMISEMPDINKDAVEYIKVKVRLNHYSESSDLD